MSTKLKNKKKIIIIIIPFLPSNGVGDGFIFRVIKLLYFNLFSNFQAHNTHKRYVND